MRAILYPLAIPFLLVVFASTGIAAIRVDAAIPGGNIIVDSIKGDTITVHRDMRDTGSDDWFYYYFRVLDADGHNITVNFTQDNPMAAFGPAVSTDGGATWKWLGTEFEVHGDVIGATFRYAVPKDAKEVRFCVAMPYMEATLKAFLKLHQSNPNLRVTTLCKTKKGRDTEALYLGRLDGKSEIRALITARHHSCEMMASWAVQGIMESILADTPDGKWLREHVEFLVVPFMDKDGVEDGDQGKNRLPWDHNRDYAGDSIYPSTAALRTLAPEWSAGKLRFALDMHDPWVRGKCDEVIYGMFGSVEAERFAKIVEAVETGPLVFRFEDYAPCRAQGNGPDMITYATPRKTFNGWAKELPGMKLSTGFELPYATATGRPVTIESATSFGHDVAKAMRRYFEEAH
jgi:hypothetical protein